MGCDGGTIPRRDELVRTKKKPEQKDKDSERLYRWRHCAVSQKKLRSPIVACELGRLYNKDEVITRLLARTSEDVMVHIRGLKDIKELKLTPNPGYKKEGANLGDQYVDRQTAEYICPVTMLEMNGKYAFSFIWTCGCVISERAMKEIKSEICHKCNSPFSKDDVISLNASEDELEDQSTTMMLRRIKAKKAKKEKRSQEGDNSTEPNNKKKKLAKGSEGAGCSREASTSSKSILFVGGSASSVLRHQDFQKVRSSGFSVASDPGASEVFKSIFDTHKTAKNKISAHWVTCNPQYF